MRELEQKQKMKRRLYSTPALIALAVFTVILVRGAVLVMIKKDQSAQHVAELNAQTKDLEARQSELQANIDKLKTDEGIDEEIKKKFSVSKEGEHVAIIVDARTATATATATKNSWFQDWWNTMKSLWHGI